jgi:Cu(I)/Ag(I) efflux system membrane fusion protein
MKDCPMMVRVDLKPGEKINCPVCGDYITTSSGNIIPAEAGAHPAGPTVMISAEKQQLIGVTTAPVQKRHLSTTIRASGKIAFDPGLFVTQEEFIQALNNEDALKDSPLSDARERAKSLAAAARRKLTLLGMDEDQIAGLAKSRTPDRGLYLPLAGDRVWAYLAIYEYEIGLVKKGAAVELSAVAYPGGKFPGTVASINPVLDPMTRTNQVRVEVANPDNKLKPEMYVNAELFVDLGEKPAVPMTAVMDTGVRKIVYLSRGGGVLEAREIRVGRSAGGYYEIMEGLAPGDFVVTSGNFLIDAESRLKAAQEGTGHHH